MNVSRNKPLDPYCITYVLDFIALKIARCTKYIPLFRFRVTHNKHTIYYQLLENLTQKEMLEQYRAK